MNRKGYYKKFHEPVRIVFLLLFILACREKAPSSDIKSEDRPFASGRPMIIEIVDSSKTVSIDKLKKVLNGHINGMDTIYRWKDHYVLYEMIRNEQDARSVLAKEFEDAEVKVYDAPFYRFDRSRCDTGAEAKEWNHVLLTANLVEDAGLQKEYLDHHETQFEKWPEVSWGFCRADFQQLLLYRNERQLMLVISIPKGKSLDELNPRTTENNPRVDQWNSLMKKYQEGIPGTSKDEVWVFLKPVPVNSDLQ